MMAPGATWLQSIGVNSGLALNVVFLACSYIRATLVNLFLKEKYLQHSINNSINLVALHLTLFALYF